MANLSDRSGLDTSDPVFRAGIQEGEQRATKKALDFLQAKYMDKTHARGSIEAEAILTVAHDLAAHLRHG